MPLDNITPIKAAKRSFIIRFLKRYTKEDYQRRLAKTEFHLNRLPMDDKDQLKWEIEIAEIRKMTADVEAAIADAEKTIHDMASRLAKGTRTDKVAQTVKNLLAESERLQKEGNTGEAQRKSKEAENLLENTITDADRTKAQEMQDQALKAQSAATVSLPTKHKEAYLRLKRIKNEVRQAAEAFSRGEWGEATMSRFKRFDEDVVRYERDVAHALAAIQSIDQAVVDGWIGEIKALPLPPLEISDQDALNALKAKQSECASKLREAEEAGKNLLEMLQTIGDPERVMVGLRKRITILNATRPKAMYELSSTKRDPAEHLQWVWNNHSGNFKRLNGQYVTRAYVQNRLKDLANIKSQLDQEIENQQRRWALPPLPPIPLDEPPLRAPPPPPEE